jgi:hypothetical protein
VPLAASRACFAKRERIERRERHDLDLGRRGGLAIGDLESIETIGGAGAGPRRVNRADVAVRLPHHEWRAAGRAECADRHRLRVEERRNDGRQRLRTHRAFRRIHNDAADARERERAALRCLERPFRQHDAVDHLEQLVGALEIEREPLECSGVEIGVSDDTAAGDSAYDGGEARRANERIPLGFDTPGW